MLHIRETAFDLCLELSKAAYKSGEIPVSAVITCQDEIVSACHNQTKDSFNPCAHAEILAIATAAKKLKSTHLLDCDLYTSLEPCLMCYQAAKIARIRHIYFILNDPDFGVFTRYRHPDLSQSHSHKISASGPFPEYDRANILKAFFQEKRKKP